MNTSRRSTNSGPIPRWLAGAGITAALMVPLSANADHRSSGAVEVLVSAAVSYALIDAVGGFDDGKKHRRDSYRYREGRHEQSRHRQERSAWQQRSRHDHGYNGYHRHLNKHQRRHGQQHRKRHHKHHQLKRHHQQHYQHHQQHYQQRHQQRHQQHRREGGQRYRHQAFH